MNFDIIKKEKLFDEMEPVNLVNKNWENKKMEVMQEMTREEFRTIMEMVRMIIDGSKDKADALQKIDSLTILKGNDKDREKDE